MVNHPLTIRPLREEDYPLWDVLVQSSSVGTVFQKSDYVRCVQESFRRPAHIVGVFSGTRLIGGTILFPQKKLFLEYSTTPYFVPYNGIVLNDFPSKQFYYNRIGQQNRIIQQLLQYVEKRFAFVELHLHNQFPDVRPIVWQGWEFIPEITAVSDLQEDIYARMDRDQRRRLRRLEEKDLRLIDSCPPETLVNLWKTSYQRHHKKPPLPEKDLLSFVQNLVNSKFARIWALTLKNNVVTALLVVEDKDTVYALFSGRSGTSGLSSEELYLFYRVMLAYRETGIQKMDFLGAMEPSIAKVKLELGSRLQRSDRIRYFRNPVVKNFVGWWEFRQQKQRLLK